MTMTDPIADMLTRSRNALKASHEQVDIPSSKIKVSIAKVLKAEGFVQELRGCPKEPDFLGKMSGLVNGVGTGALNEQHYSAAALRPPAVHGPPGFKIVPFGGISRNESQL